MKIRKLLVANRGEIACRIFRTCRVLGIETVAVWSDADRFSKHVREADEAVRIGPAPSVESYLKQDAVIAAAKSVGADAIHPGYGFLSENASFAEVVEAAGLIWIGPTAETIRALGLKDEAKRIAEEAGVPVLPGYRGDDQSLKTLSAAAETIGFPLLIKAVAGGGGRGIREVRSADDLKGQLESAVREAESAFGDGRVMLEKLVEKPRHIEVQVFGDGKGKAVHLFERDCSFQRRRQKVIEEAPAPNMPDKVRKAMTDAAVALAEAVSYRGAGTVEFIVDGTKPLSVDTFFFLEMNTRLQVEHPVTEMITGQDLVAWQIRVATEGKLPVRQKDLAINGHAIEARICAEDPADGFRPGAGRLMLFEGPEGLPKHAVRWETGFETGDMVPSFYDSMIAKLVIWAETREDAIAQSVDALAETQLSGVPSNIPFLRACMMTEIFADGTHHVNAIGEMGDALIPESEPVRLAAIGAAADYHTYEAEAPGLADPWAIRDGFRVNSTARTVVFMRTGDEPEPVDLSAAAPAGEMMVTLTPVLKRGYVATAEGLSFLVTRPDFDSDADAIGSGDVIKAPMPGKVISVKVSAGEAVSKGQVLAVMEAMKMEHALAAPRDGQVQAVPAEAGAQVAEGDVLIALQPEEN